LAWGPGSLAAAGRRLATQGDTTQPRVRRLLEGDTERPSPKNNCRSWRLRLPRVTIRISTSGRNWPGSPNLTRPVSRSVKQFRIGWVYLHVIANLTHKIVIMLKPRYHSMIASMPNSRPRESTSSLRNIRNIPQLLAFCTYFHYHCTIAVYTATTNIMTTRQQLFNSCPNDYLSIYLYIYQLI